MASSLLVPCFWSDCDNMQVRKLHGWQSAEYNGRVRCRTILLTDLQHDEIVLFSSYVMAELTLPMSSIFLMLLDNYGLQLHHLTLHAIASVAIFAHFCEMFMGMQPSVHLF
jgi:hypothetical protein